MTAWLSFQLTAARRRLAASGIPFIMLVMFQLTAARRRLDNYGADLNAEELKWLEEDGVSDFGWTEFCYDIEAAIEEELA